MARRRRLKQFYCRPCGSTVLQLQRDIMDLALLRHHILRAVRFQHGGQRGRIPLQGGRRRGVGHHLVQVGDDRFQHGLDDFADVGGLRFQFRHHRDRGGLALRGQGHVVDQAAEIVGSALDQPLHGLALVLAQRCIVQLARDGLRYLLEAGQRFLGGAGRGVRVRRDLVRRAAQLFGSGGGFIDAGRQQGSGRRDPLRRLLLLGQRASAFALRIGVARADGSQFAGFRMLGQGGDFFDEGHSSIPLVRVGERRRRGINGRRHGAPLA